jgi:hypothetical protein
VSISGTLLINQQLTGQYTFADVDLDPQGTSTFRWLRGAGAIDGATGLAYTTITADAGQTLTFEVTPRAGSGTTPGNAATGSVVIARVTSVVSWANPDAIVHGTALAAMQLNATASVAGTFSYTPPTGTVLSAGLGQTLAVAFTPDDTAGYTNAGKTVTIDVTAGTALSFTDASLFAGMTPVRAVHVSELRDRINAVRIRLGLDAFMWTEATLTPGETALRAVHILELRSALQAAYVAAQRAAPVFLDTDLQSAQAVKAIHLIELRNAVIALE